MTNDTVKAPNSWVWLVAACLIAGIAAAIFGSAAEWLAGVLFIYVGGSAVVTIGRWLWFSAQERMRPHRG